MDEEHKSHQFDQVWGRLVAMQSKLAASQASENVDARTDDEMDRILSEMGEATWALIRTRAIHKWQILHKVEHLQELLDGGNNWLDNRDHLLLASIRLDLG